MEKVIVPSKLFEQEVGVVLTSIMETTCAERDAADKASRRMANTVYLYLFI
jgi:hypothetical protein